MSIRIGIIDSGINPEHPHLGPVHCGVFITATGLDRNFIDCLGHGTAVAAAIHNQAPDAELHAVRIFDRRLSANIEILLRALDWCLDHNMHLINLSLGTANEGHRASLEQRVVRAAGQAALIVAAAGMLPGSIRGTISVAPDATLPRSHCRFEGGIYFASPYPRDIPGVPRERNLSGVSFAVANCTGILARLMESRTQAEALAELQRGSSSNPFSR